MSKQTPDNGPDHGTGDSALDVLAELIAIRSGGGDSATRLDREQDAWNRAGALVDKKGN